MHIHIYIYRPYYTDFGGSHIDSKCTSVLEMAISAALVSLKSDTTMASLWQRTLASSSTMDCPLPSEASAAADLSAMQLGFPDLQGVFVIYIASLVLSVLAFAVKVAHGRGWLKPLETYMLEKVKIVKAMTKTPSLKKIKEESTQIDDKINS